MFQQLGFHLSTALHDICLQISDHDEQCTAGGVSTKASMALYSSLTFKHLIDLFLMADRKSTINNINADRAFRCVSKHNHEPGFPYFTESIKPFLTCLLTSAGQVT